MNTLLHNTDVALRPTSGQRQAIVQPKLTVNAPGDRHEQEADSLASRAVGGEKVAVRQQVGATGGQAAPAAVAAQLGKGGGATLPTGTRSVMETAFSADFSRVRVHADGGAAQLNQQMGARAFTHGSDIYFGAGQYAPKTQPGQHLLAHELTHTVQQQGSAGGLLQREEDPTASQATAAPTPFQPVQEQWQNDNLAATIYPFRKQMYQRLLRLYGDTIKYGNLLKDDPSLTADALYPAVRDTLAKSTIPLWAQQTFLEHAGMRYYHSADKKGPKGAHGTWLPPWLLIDIWHKLDKPDQKAPASVRRRPTKDGVVGQSNAELLGYLQQEHAKGRIKPNAWRYIVSKTSLRHDTTEANLENASLNLVEEETEEDQIWKKALTQWTKHELSATIWHTELEDTGAVDITAIVCNQLAEVAQRHRGVKLPGGIAANANMMFDQALKSRMTASLDSMVNFYRVISGQVPAAPKAATPAPFFVHGPNITFAHLQPGASVFTLAKDWQNSPAEAHARVMPYPGAKFPVPLTEAEEKANSKRGLPWPIIEEDLEFGGWVYHIGDQISRTQTPATGTKTQWMHWSHQATIVGPDPKTDQEDPKSFILLETTKIGAGFSTLLRSSLQSPFLFVAWQPDGPGGTTTFTPPATP